MAYPVALNRRTLLPSPLDVSLTIAYPGKIAHRKQEGKEDRDTFEHLADGTILATCDGKTSVTDWSPCVSLTRGSTKETKSGLVDIK